jgi:bifunctional ADP-heptose synthase (sugar kinase/adenylyltransferase)
MTESMNTQQQKKFKILLLGDDCLDIYQYGRVDRISPEAPVPVFLMGTRTDRPGMVSNVKQNLKNLGCSVEMVHGYTSTKTRFLDERSNQQIIRIDNDNVSSPLTMENIPKGEFDAIVISDYNKGTISYGLVELLRSKYTCPIFIDSKKPDLKRFEGCIVKINSREYDEAISSCRELIVTRASKGAIYKGREFPARKVDVVDVTGAGDTFLAALTYMYLVTNDMYKSIEFAIRASEITVKHLGVYAPKLEEICD